MKLSQIAAQLYTVRAHTQTAADLATTARRIRRIGYHAVQLSALGPMPPAEVKRIMEGEGLVVCATHEPGDDILGQPDRCIERLHSLGCRLTAYPYPKGIDLGDSPAVEDFVRRLDAAGARFHTAGLTLGYHNHAIEFVKIHGTTVLDFIFASTDPRHLAAELDTYWIQYGGGDTVEWCRKMRGRLPFIHLKDYAFTLQNRPTYCEVGDGTLPFERIVPEAEAAGCEWFIVEQDDCPADPFDSLARSFDYLKSRFTK